jgi:ELWxxDGT repeat protein
VRTNMRHVSGLTVAASFAAALLQCTSSPTGIGPDGSAFGTGARWWGAGGAFGGSSGGTIGAGTGGAIGGFGGIGAGGSAGSGLDGSAGSGSAGSGTDGGDGGIIGCTAGLPCARFLADLNPGPSGSVVGQFAEFRGRSHFFAVGSGGGLPLSLWSTDGTSAGTKKLLDAPARALDFTSHNSRPVVFKDRLYFTAWPDDIGQEIFVYDGVSISALEANPGPLHSWDVAHPFLATTSKAVVWQGSQPGGNSQGGLWAADGVSAPVLIDDPNTWVTSCGVLDTDTVLFSAHPWPPSPNGGNEDSLYRTDGTVAGRTKIFDRLGLANLEHGVSMNGSFYFNPSGRPGGTVEEVWRTDGTTAGTVKVADLPSTTTQIIQRFFVAGNLVYFAYNDNVAKTGFELWRTDGTAAGTFMVKDVYPGAEYGVSFSDEDQWFGANGGALIFRAKNLTSMMWSTRGTAADSHPLAGFEDGWHTSPGDLLVSPPYLFFAFVPFSGSGKGIGQWWGDGSGQFAPLRADEPLPSTSDGFYAAGNQTFMMAQAGDARGSELWIIDHDSAGSSGAGGSSGGGGASGAAGAAGMGDVGGASGGGAGGAAGAAETGGAGGVSGGGSGGSSGTGGAALACPVELGPCPTTAQGTEGICVSGQCVQCASPAGVFDDTCMQIGGSALCCSAAHTCVTCTTPGASPAGR